MSISSVVRSLPVSGTASLDHFLSARSDQTPDQTAFAYLRDGEQLQCALTYRDLDAAATRVAASLCAAGSSNGRVIVGLPPGIDFVTAFFGCLRARAAAVPVPHYLGRRSMQRFAAIHRSAEPTAIIVARSDRDRLVNLCRAHGIENAAPVLAFEDLAVAGPEDHRLPPPGADDLAVIQYTSGSTRDPRGVLVTHGMLVHNCECVSTAHQYAHGTGLVTWLPAFHDMGLIGGLLNPLYAVLTSYIIDPAVFLQRPAVWLRAMSTYGCSHTGGPNFGYEHCVRMIRPEECTGLDLTALRVASIGAEPVSPRTMRRFAERFGPYGFREAAFAPCYGLAEATLQVTAAEPGRTPLSIVADRDALSRGSLQPRAVVARNGAAAGTCEFASCGTSRADTAVVIVDPHTHAECAPRSVGEIWVTGPSVSAGYWNAQQETDESFQARLSDGRGPFLRTGDLGVLHDGELYITGRMKELLILRGQNYYPRDIEQIALGAHPDLVAEAAAAFAVAPHDTGRIDESAPECERLVLVLEVRRERSREDGLRDILTAVRKAVSEELGLAPAAIILVRPGAIPRTSSGKVRRNAARDAFLAGELTALARQVTEPALSDLNGNGHALHRTAAAVRSERHAEPPPVHDDRDVEIGRWLRDYAGRHFDAQLADERRCIPPHVVLDFGNQGLMGLRVPRSYGGLELSARSASRVIEQLAAIDLTLALFVGLHNSLGLLPILRSASPEVRDAEVPRLASGRALAAFALTEPGAGSHPQAIRSRAEPDGAGQWRLHGVKWWSGTAAWASVINVFVQTLDDRGQPAGISGFVVPRDAAGLRQGKESLTLGFRGMVQNIVHLDGVPVTARQLLGRPGAGMDEALHAMTIARLGIAAMSLGAMKRCLRLVSRFAERRDIGTGRLAENPTFRHRLAGHVCALRALQQLVDFCNGILDSGGDVPEELYLVAKTAGPELLYDTADDAMQFLGGRGYIETNILPRILRDARGLRIFEGPTETLHAHLGARLLASEACFTWLRNNLAAPRAVTALDAAKAELTGGRSLNDPKAPLDLQRWKQATLGDAATWLILAAIVESRPGSDDRTLAWLHARAGSALRRWHAGSFPVAKNDLYEQLDSVIGSVGDVWSEAAGEETLPDELLRPDAPEPARPAVPQIEPPAVNIDHGARRPRADDSSHALEADTARWTEWLSAWIARRLQTPLDEIDPDATLVSLGLDSLNAVELAYAIEDEQGIKLPPTAAWSFPTVRSMARYLGATQRTTHSVALNGEENSQLAEVLDLAGRRPDHWNRDAKGI